MSLQSNLASHLTPCLPKKYEFSIYQLKTIRPIWTEVGRNDQPVAQRYAFILFWPIQCILKFPPTFQIREMSHTKFKLPDSPQNQNTWATTLYCVPNAAALWVVIHHQYCQENFLGTENYFSWSIFLSKLVIKNRWRRLHIQRQMEESIFLFVSEVPSCKFNVWTLSLLYTSLLMPEWAV